MLYVMSVSPSVVVVIMIALVMVVMMVITVPRKIMIPVVVWGVIMMVKMFFMYNWRAVMVLIMVVMVLNNMVSWVVRVRIPVFTVCIIVMLSCMRVEEIMCLMMRIWMNCLMMDGWSGVMWSLMVDWSSFVMNWCWMSISVSWCVSWNI